MVRPVEQDARGIIRPAEGLRRFRLDRWPPSPGVARFVDRYWVSTWDQGDSPPHTQQVLSHPAVNVVLTDGSATVHGVSTGVTSRTLRGRGRAVGVLFRPAGFRPFLGRPLATVTDTAVPAADLLGPAIASLAAGMDGHSTPDLVAAVDALLADLVPADRQPCEDTADLIDGVAREPAGVRVEALAAAAGLSVRQLQRRFADHVGLTPKAVLRRYRLFEAAERVRRQGARAAAAAGSGIDWAALAAELHYSDQPHLVRDFHATFGMSPERYARASAGQS